MAKTTKTRRSHGMGKPYLTQKPRVDVTFDEPSTSVPKKRVTIAEDIPQTNGGSSAKDVKGKGKAKDTSAAPLTADETLSIRPSEDGPSTFMIVAGSYEKLLYGLEGTFDSSSGSPSLKPIFIFPAHLACVKAIAASPGGKWLATGSEDEFIKIWDLRRRKEVGSLSQHEGSITSLQFPSSSHLVSTSVDSTISIFRTSDWALLKSLKGHSGRINYVDVHPTGRVALTVGKDKTLKMWDLMRGRGAASLQLGKEAEMVKFSPKGTHFAVLYPKRIELYSLTLKLLHTLETQSRFNTMVFSLLPPDQIMTDDDEDSEIEETEVLCVGTEKGVIEVYAVEMDEVEDGEEIDNDDDEDAPKEGGSGASMDLIATLEGHFNRVKSISALPFIISAAPTSSPQKTILLTSASSDGRIHLYDLGSVSTSSESALQPIAQYDTKGSRLTCVFLAEGRKAGTAIKAVSNGMSTGIHNGHATDAFPTLVDESHDGQASLSDLGDDDDDMYEQDSEDGQEDGSGLEVEIEDEDEDEDEYEEE